MTIEVPEWYAEGLVSQGKASEIAGVSRPEFLAELAKRKVPVSQMTVDDLMMELESLREGDYPTRGQRLSPF